MDRLDQLLIGLSHNNTIDNLEGRASSITDEPIYYTTSAKFLYSQFMVQFVFRRVGTDDARHIDITTGCFECSLDHSSVDMGNAWHRRDGKPNVTFTMIHYRPPSEEAHRAEIFAFPGVIIGRLRAFSAREHKAMPMNQVYGHNLLQGKPPIGLR
ncbi:uncharacterized protein BJX67DRAFT_60535 [Aspergillus lucknowensis]|uniref:Uncharacterized protein n=1 Tax=Aspergillus lucknowensis TaxID=176173 RepID=A0ABR4LU64_9EURO